MANRKISDLVALTTPASGDYLPIVDISEAAAADKNKRITIEELMRGVPDGTAAAPGISFDGDNTGIYRPGADQIAISTNGTGRLFVDASGNVGVAKSNPRTNLDVAGNIYMNGNTQIQIATAANTAGLQIIGQDSAESVIGTMSAQALVLRTTSQERLRITSGGLVGIGTSSPQASARLHVYATGDYTDESAPFTVGDSTTGGMRLFFGINNTSNYGYIGSVESGTAYRSLVLQPGGGSVGVGTTSPGSILTVNDPGTGLQFINAASGNYNIGLLGGTGSADAYIFNRANSPLILGTANTERARIDSSGRLLVGTASNSGGALLQINGDRIRVGTAKTPASATDTGTAGEICWDANYVYVCTATNTWKRSALSTW